MGDFNASAETFGLFVSSVEGQPCTRFGSSVLIGADRDPKAPNKLIYRTDEIIAIPRAEAEKYAREYARLIAEKSLVEHTAAEWTKQQEHGREVGAPVDELKSGKLDEAQAKESHAHHQGGRQ
jgi:hypothetical protein